MTAFSSYITNLSNTITEAIKGAKYLQSFGAWDSAEAALAEAEEDIAWYVKQGGDGAKHLRAIKRLRVAHAAHKAARAAEDAEFEAA